MDKLRITVWSMIAIFAVALVSAAVIDVGDVTISDDKKIKLDKSLDKKGMTEVEFAQQAVQEKIDQEIDRDMGSMINEIDKVMADCYIAGDYDCIEDIHKKVVE